MSRRILYLETHRLTAYDWQGGNVSPEGTFEPTPDGLSRFGDYLRRHASSRFSLLANVAEEGFQIEEIPFLGGADRRALISRRLSQNFFGTTLTTATSLGYEKEKRKNEKLLLAAFTNPAPFDPWLAALRQAEVPLTGIYSVAQQGGRLLAGITTPPARCLLLTMQDNTLRESFIVNGITLFSRIAPVTDSSLAGTAAAFAAEAAKLHQYLLGQRLVGRNETLTALVLAHPLAIRAVQHSCISSGNLHFEILDCHQLARQYHLRTLPPDSRSEILFIHLLATRPPSQQYAGEELRRNYRLLQIRRGLLTFAALAFLAAFIFASSQFFDGMRLADDTATLQASEAEMQRRYRDIAATFPQLKIDSDALRQLIGHYGTLQQQQGGPRSMLLPLSRVLDRFPGVDIDRLEWKQAQASGEAHPEDFLLLGGNIRMPRKSAPRQILAAFDDFVQALSAQAEFVTSIQQAPFDIGSGQSLKASNSNEPLTQRPFLLRITRKAVP